MRESQTKPKARKMGIRLSQVFVVLLFMAMKLVHCEHHWHYSKKSSKIHQSAERVTYLHFYYFDIHTGPNPSAVVVGRTNDTGGTERSSAPFGTVYAINNVLREGPEETSNVIGNARGMYVSASQDAKVTLVMYVDYGFTAGELNGSSISVLSRNPVTEPTRELSVVGGRGKFRMARGFAQIRAHFLNVTTGDGIIEYNVTVFH